MTTKPKKAYRGMAMEGMIARWYAKNTARSLDSYRDSARAVAARLPAGGDVLEVAPGPGYLAIELARLGPYRVVGLDISQSFVSMAAENAKVAGVAVDFRLGNASAMPFEAGGVRVLVWPGALKKFTQTIQAPSGNHPLFGPPPPG